MMGKLYDAIMEKYGQDAVEIVDVRFQADERGHHNGDTEELADALAECIRNSERVNLHDLIK